MTTRRAALCLFLAAVSAGPLSAQPLREKPAAPAPAPRSADPRVEALLAWVEGVFPWGAGETTLDELPQVVMPGWRLYRAEKKYKADTRMNDATFLAVDDRGQWVIVGDAFVDEARVRLKQPPKTDADLEGLRAQLKRFFRGGFRLVFDPAHDRPSWKAVTVKLDTGYGEYEVGGYVKADDGALLMLGRAWERKRPIVEQRLAMLNVKETPFDGPADARVTIVEFSDMQCSYCKKRTADWEPLLAKLAGQLTIKRYFKFFPLTTEHPWAFRAASAGLCLFQERGSSIFLRFKKYVYSQQETMTVPGMDMFALDFAGANEVPAESFKGCYLKDRSNQRILNDLTEGFALRVRATPTYFIDGVPVSWFSDELMEEYLRRTYLKAPAPATKAAPAAGTR